MARRRGQVVTVKQGFAGRPVVDDAIHEIGMPIDLGITLSIYGKSQDRKPKTRDTGIVRRTTKSSSVEIDAWPTEH